MAICEAPEILRSEAYFRMNAAGACLPSGMGVFQDPDEKRFLSGCSKMLKCKALEVLRSEAYLAYAATTKDERNEVDGYFSAAC